MVHLDAFGMIWEDLDGCSWMFQISPATFEGPTLRLVQSGRMLISWDRGSRDNIFEWPRSRPPSQRHSWRLQVVGCSGRWTVRIILLSGQSKVTTWALSGRVSIFSLFPLSCYKRPLFLLSTSKSSILAIKPSNLCCWFLSLLLFLATERCCDSQLLLVQFESSLLAIVGRVPKRFCLKPNIKNQYSDVPTILWQWHRINDEYNI